MSTQHQMETWNSFFKQGRRAGQEDVAKAILKADTTSAHEIARAFLAAHETDNIKRISS